MPQRQSIIPRLLLVLTAFLLFGSLLLVSTWQQGKTYVAHAEVNNLGQKPYMGWSSWSMESTTASGYGTSWLTEAHVKAQADVVH
ncbi:MAG TPA: carbohydrate-binding protein, partial [Ktedonobacteraceae bacterium]